MNHVAHSTAGYRARSFPAVTGRRCLRYLLPFLFLAPGTTPLAQDEVSIERLIFDVVALPEQQENPQSSSGGNPGAPPSDEAGDNASIAQYQAQLDTLLAEQGLFSPERREQLEALGLLLQEQGAHSEALQAFAEALHIERVNNGLYTLSQLPLVDSIIVSHDALHDFKEVDDYHAYRYYVEQRAYPDGDPRLLAAKEAWADWNVESYLKRASARDSFSITTGPVGPLGDDTDYVAIQNPVTGSYNYVPRHQLPYVLGPGAAPGGFYRNSMAYSVSPEMIVDERLRTASDLYEEIQQAQGDTIVPDIARKRANVDLAIKRRLDQTDTITDSRSLYRSRVLLDRSPPPLVTRGYTRNRDALAALAEQSAANPDNNPTDTARAYIHLGDWHLGYGYTGRAEDAYLQAWTLLHENGLSTVEIDDIFAPGPLIPVPAFASHPFSRALYGIAPDASLMYAGHIDVRLNLSQSGRVQSPQIVAVSEGTSQRLRRTLLDYLRDQRMRPALVDGALVERRDMQVRYYYAY